MKKTTQTMLHSIPKADKKGKKEMNEKVKKMEEEMIARHARELKSLEEAADQVVNLILPSIPKETIAEDVSGMTLMPTQPKMSKKGKREVNRRIFQPSGSSVSEGERKRGAHSRGKERDGQSQTH